MSIAKNKKEEEEKGGIISVEGQNDESTYLYCILPQAFISEHGLLNVAVVGKFLDTQTDKDDNLVVDSFEANPDFVHLLHQLLGDLGRQSKALIMQATRQQEDSWVYIIDQRVKDTSAAIAPEDIIGGFKVKNGKLDEYAGNPGHVLLTKEGIFQIGSELKTELIHFIKSQYTPKEQNPSAP
jgi:hypothetical protein